MPGGGVDGLAGHRRTRCRLARGDRLVGLVPGGVGGQDQGRDLTRRGPRGLDRGGAVGGDVLGRRRGLHPVRDRPRQPLDVGGQRSVVGDVIGGMLAHHVDHAGVRLAGVVQVGEAVGEAGTEVQQGRGRLARHAPVAVGRAGHHALEQAEHAAHAGHLVQRGDKMHLRRAWVGEANIDPAGQQGSDKALGAVHAMISRCRVGEVRERRAGGAKSHLVVRVASVSPERRTRQARAAPGDGSGAFDGAHASRLVVADRRDQFVARVHDEGAVACHGLADRLAAEQEKPPAVGAG